MKKLGLKSEKTGFTLAEVLITLTIIGVVAAVTVPTLTKKTGSQETVTRLQKVYSVLSQATNEIIFEKGSPLIWVSDVDSVYNSYKSHLKNAKDCGAGTGCAVSDTYKGLDNKIYYNLNQKESHRKLILSDGTIINFAAVSADCSRNDLNGLGTKDVCAFIDTDLNGAKKPNMLGRDTFTFALKSDGLYPGGCEKDTCDSNYSGWGCACKVLSEGKIDY